MFAPSKFTFRRLRDSATMREWRSPTLNLTARIACEKCNTGWMSDLEAETQRIAGDMILHGAAASLTARAVAVLGVFAFKNALIADSLRRDRVSFFEGPVRHRFAKTLHIPNGTKIWLAKAEHPSGLLRPSYHELRGTAFEVYTFTYIGGHLASQVVSLKWRKTHEHDSSIPDFRQTGWDDFATLIWRAEHWPVTWPPPNQLGTDLIEKFLQPMEQD